MALFGVVLIRVALSLGLAALAVQFLCLPPLARALTVLADATAESAYGFPLVVDLYSQTLSNVTFSLPLDLGGGGSIDALLSGALDFALIAAPLSAAQAASNPNVAVLPVLHSAIVPVYRLDALGPNATLTFSGSTLALIFAGSITWWNHSAIAVDNPGLALPAQRILVAYQNDSQPANLVFTTALNKFNPAIASVLPPSLLPAWPISLYARGLPAIGLTAAVSIALDVDGVIGFSPQAAAIAVGVTVGRMVNRAGQRVVAGQSSVAFTVYEMQTTPTALPTAFPDLTDCQTASCWPIVITTWLLVDLSASPRGCDVRSAVASLWLWYSASATIVERILVHYGMLQTPPLIVSASATLATVNGLSCDGHIVEAVQPAAVAYPILAPQRLAQDVSALVDFYYNVADGVDFTVVPTDAVPAVQQGWATDALAVFSAAELYSDAQHLNVIEPVIDFAQQRALPTFLVSTVITFNPQITPTLTLNASVQLVLDIPMLSDLLAGNVTDWHDPRLLALNPVLAALLPAGPAPLFVALGCPRSSDTPLFFQLLSLVERYAALPGSTPVNDGEWGPGGALAAAYAACTPVTSSWRFLEREDTVQALVAYQVGAVGYTADDATIGINGKFALLYPMVNADGSSGGLVLRHSTTAAMRACVSEVDPGTLQLNLEPETVTACWPLTDVLYAQVPQDYPVLLQAQGYHTLSFLSWLFTATTIVPWSESVMLIQVGLLPSLQPALLAAVNSVTSDGDTLLIPQDVVWQISATIQVVGLVFAGLGIVLTLAALLFVVQKRSHALYRSVSPVFVCISLLGVLWLFGSVLVLTRPLPGRRDCAALNWSLQLGFTTLFSPLVLKAYRIYRIFGRRRLQVVKISNARLLRWLLLILAVDLAYLSVWQAVAPMTAVISTQLESDQRLHAYQQCSYAQSSTSLRLFIASAVVKVGWLLVGAMLAFGTRLVSDTFNESKSVALAIYNVAFAIGLIMPIVLLTSAIGSSLVMLLMFCVLWIAFVTLAVLTVPKLLEYLTTAATDPSQVGPPAAPSSSSSSIFSFLSLSNLTSVLTATSYIQALERHLLDARAHMSSLRISQQQTKKLSHLQSNPPLPSARSSRISPIPRPSDSGLERPKDPTFHAEAAARGADGPRSKAASVESAAYRKTGSARDRSSAPLPHVPPLMPLEGLALALAVPPPLPALLLTAPPPTLLAMNVVSPAAIEQSAQQQDRAA